MTAPNVGEDPRLEQIRAMARRRGYSEEEITAKLVNAGLMQAPSPSLGQQFMHGAGLIARMGTQFAGNLASLPFGVAGAAYQGVTGRQPPAMLQGNQGTAAANQMGLPQPQGAGERIAMAAGENALTAAVLPGASAGMAALGAGAGAAGQGAAEMGASPIGQMAASAAVGMGLPVMHALGAAAIRSALAGASSRRLAAEQSLALLQAGGQDAGASLGQVTEGGMAKTLQGGLRNVPGASEVFREAGAKQAASMQGRVESIADRMGPAGTPTTAGAAIQRGIEGPPFSLSEGWVPRFRTITEKMYSKFWGMVPPDTPIKLPNTANLAAQQDYLASAARPLSDHIASPKVKQILEDAATTMDQYPNGVPFIVAKELRARMGGMLDGSEAVTDINLRDVKRLYGALSDDMAAGVAPHGSEALASWEKTNQFYMDGIEKLRTVLQPLLDKKVPEKAFTALMSGTKEGATVLQSTMGSLRPAEQNLVRSTVLRNLGHNPATDSFSPELHLTNWNKLAPEAKTALYGKAGSGTRDDLDKLAQALTLRRTAHNIMPNASGTAPNTAFFSILAGLSGAGVGAMTGTGGAGVGAGAMLGPAAAAIGSKLAANVFTNPRMIQWLVRQTKMPFGAMSQELLILAKDAEKWPPEDREIAQNLSKSLSNVDWNMVLLAHAAADASSQRPQ